MKKKWFWLIIYLAAIVVCIVLIYAVPKLMGALAGTYVVEPGKIELSQDVEAYIVRNEVVYVADRDGTVKRQAEESKLVRAGNQIVSISGAGREETDQTYERIKIQLGEAALTAADGYTGSAGYVSYKVDGAEATLTPAGLETTKKAAYEEKSGAEAVSTAKGKSQKGDPVFKIVANGDWWLVFYTDNEHAKAYTQDMNVQITIGDETVKAYVYSVKNGKQTSRITLCCSVFVKDYLTLRRVKAKVTTASAEGLIIQNQSIVEKDGHKGVLVKNKYGKNVFKRIGIKADDGTKSAVCEDIFMDETDNYVETIRVYDEIVTSPDEKDIKEAE